MAEHLGYQEDPLPRRNKHLSGGMHVWFEEDTARVVFYDFDNDEGLSLDIGEWNTAVEWWVSLDEPTADVTADTTLAPPRLPEG